jgi:hypothetical protein
MDEAEVEIFIRGAREIDDPRFAVAVFDSAVVGLIIEEKAAVFHGESLRELEVG